MVVGASSVFVADTLYAAAAYPFVERVVVAAAVAAAVAVHT